MFDPFLPTARLWHNRLVAEAAERAEMSLMRAARVLREVAGKATAQVGKPEAPLSQEDLFSGVEAVSDPAPRLGTEDLQIPSSKDR